MLGSAKGTECKSCVLYSEMVSKDRGWEASRPTNHVKALPDIRVPSIIDKHQNKIEQDGYKTRTLVSGTRKNKCTLGVGSRS
jgi:hypothetical protein